MSAPPKGHSHWSTALLGRKFGISNTAAHKVLRGDSGTTVEVAVDGVGESRTIRMIRAERK